MCYEAARQRTFLFGGSAADLFNDTWVWSGEFWTQVADTGPSARRDHAICFDNARGQVLLFGGSSKNALQGDTWVWDGEDWTQVEDSGPVARAGHRLAFDANRSRAVLFGGEARAGPLNDTWEWDGNAWTQIQDSGPGPRTNHAFAFDLTQQRTVLFGGENAQGAALRDTWIWDGKNWTQIQDIGPDARTRSFMVSTDAQLVLFGGLSSADANQQPTVFGDSWVLQANAWTKRQDIGPAPRWGHALAFDTQRRVVVLFGGHSSPALSQAADLVGDTWEHLETDPPATQNNSQAGGGQLVQMTLSPIAANPEQQVTAQITAVPSQTTLALTLVWIAQSVVDKSNNTNGQVSQSDIHLLGQLPVPAQASNAAFSFPAPNAGEPVLVVAYDGAGESVEAPLTLT